MPSRSNITDSFAAEDLNSLDASLLNSRTASTNPVYTGAWNSSPFSMQTAPVSIAHSTALEKNFKFLKECSKDESNICQLKKQRRMQISSSMHGTDRSKYFPIYITVDSDFFFRHDFCGSPQFDHSSF